MGKLIEIIAREVVYKDTIIKCEMPDCGRLMYPGMPYIVVEGEALGGKRKKICETCLEKLGWEYPDIQR